MWVKVGIFSGFVIKLTFGKYAPPPAWQPQSFNHDAPFSRMGQPQAEVYALPSHRRTARLPADNQIANLQNNKIKH
jgi:hypothetical protein